MPSPHPNSSPNPSRHDAPRPTHRSLTPQQIAQMLHDPQLRLFDAPGMIGLAQQLMANPDDEALAEMFHERVEQCRFEASVEDDPFRANMPPCGTVLCQTGDIGLFTLPTAAILGLISGELPNNLLVSGPTGSGKSTIARQVVRPLPRKGMVVVMFDRKREHRRLLNDPVAGPFCCVLNLTDLAMALYQAIPGVPREVVIAATTDLLARSTGRMYAQRLLNDLIERLLPAWNANDGIALAELVDHFKAMRVGGAYRQQDLKESMLLSLQHLKVHLRLPFAYRRSNLLEKLFEKPGLYIIELDTLPGDLYAFMVGLFLQHPYLARLHGNQGQRLPIIFVLDDVTTATDKQLDRQSASGTSVLVEQAFMGRGLGMGQILCLHAPGSASEKLLRNCRNVILTGAQGENATLLRTLLGLTPEQADAARVLEQDQAVALFPTRWSKPLLGRFADLPLKPVSEAMVKLSARRLLDQVRCEQVSSPATNTSPASTATATPATASTAPAAGTSKPSFSNTSPAQQKKASAADHPSSRSAQAKKTQRSSKTASQGTGSTSSPTTAPRTANTASSNPPDPAPNLTSDDHQALAPLACRLPPTITEWYRTLGVGAKKGQALIRRLEAKDLVRLYRCQGGRGRPLMLPLLTEAGWHELEQHQLAKRPAPLTHGGPLHDLAAEALRLLARREQAQVLFEQDLGPLRVDVRWRYADGRCVYFQIGVSDPQREADALTRALSVPGLTPQRLVLIAQTRDFADKVRTLLRSQVGDQADRVGVRLLGALIKAVR